MSSLFVACRTGDPANGRWGPVGRLDRIPSGYRFVYTRGAETMEKFSPFAGMPDLHEVYESNALFPLFANRLLGRSRPEYEAFLEWGGFDPGNPPDPIAILGVSEGRRATDSLELFPCPEPDANGCYINKFFLHGIQWEPPEAQARIGRLEPGEILKLMLDLQNDDDTRAVAVRTNDTPGRALIGYIPRYLAKDVRHLASQCDLDHMTLMVERVNADAPLQQRLLCRMTACWPESFRPCAGDEFDPLVDTLVSELPG